jgi:hypothetical protein
MAQSKLLGQQYNYQLRSRRGKVWAPNQEECISEKESNKTQLNDLLENKLGETLEEN